MTNHHGGAARADNIQQLIHFARDNYASSPSESLACLMQALTLNSGQASADTAMIRLRQELGDDLADHVGNHSYRMERAVQMVEALLRDESTFLFQQGCQDILRQTMEDGSSVVCSNCGDVVASARWQQHQQYWCRVVVADANTSHDNPEGGGEGECKSDDMNM